MKPSSRLLARIATLPICCLVLTAALGAQAPTAQRPRPKPVAAPAAEGMSNADVIKMTAAGLSESIIISAIKGAKVSNFDTSVDGLVALKKAGVSEAVIALMQEPRSAELAAAPPPTPAPSRPETRAAIEADDGVPELVAAEPGLYYIGPGGVVRLEAKTPYQTRTGSTLVSRLTLGIKPSRINAMLMGLRAELQVPQSPKFYIHLAQVLGQSESVGEYYLVKFTVKEGRGRREIEIGSANFAKFQAGLPEKDCSNWYLMSPKSAR